ncbi:ATP-binding protein [Clostridium magnum]|uniref:ATPase family associated with various cellular activitie n=1 Tax=Clostridium magnum DSM 2767 TaxID=1121326 RepID=A0A161WI29_9CLOT|nr:ATP-binding protein [Clostridium magnum]KZL91365.1 ATPase family associated with various cellular activitie [Clostridium magnum DSM 2767]SHH39682.1 hypothetical protein SAMN02745944_00564 [Clostridium magnum DSM 2767]
MTKNKIINAKIALDSLSTYRGLLQDKVLNELNGLLTYLLSQEKEISTIINKYNDFYYCLINSNSTNTFKSYIINCILFDTNVFSKAAEIKEFSSINNCIKNAVVNDLLCLQRIASLSAEDIKSYLKETNLHWDYEINVVMALPVWDFKDYISSNSKINSIFEEFNTSEDWNLCIEKLADFYKENGTGIFAKYKGFVWEKQNSIGRLKGIDAPDPIRISDLIEYNFERKIIVENTLSFLKGNSANNILLYGDRGTGKSSTVKALLNEYCDQGLRIIELQKAFVSDFSEVIRAIKNSSLKFIVFIDDLAFEDNEENYTALKAVLEGGLESTPKNLIIYATSNRRHLIKETHSGREDEIHSSDAMQEKLSLADRFGITVTFLSPDQNKYLEIVEGMVRNRGLIIEKEQLKKQALVWEMRYNGRSPRTAKQFVDWLEGQLN